MTWTGPPPRLVALWIVACTAAELAGICLAAIWWIAMDRADPTPATLAAKLLSLGLKSLSGVVEGGVLGTLQALALRRIYPRLPVALWVMLTMLLAVLGWAAGSAVPIFVTADPGQAAAPEPALALTLLAGAAMGLALGALFGAVQAIAFRHAATRTGWWIAVNAAGWGVALPLIYAVASTGPPEMETVRLVAKALAAGLGAGLILGCVTALALRVMAPRG
jgi:hypothetical protein